MLTPATKKIVLETAAAITLASPLLAGCVATHDVAIRQNPANVQVAGRWAGGVQNPLYGGRVDQIVLDLKVEGGKLTGTLAGNGDPVEIHDGIMSGAKISFLTTRTTSQYGSVTLKNSGEVKGDELTLNREVMGANGAGSPPSLLLKRVK